MRGWRSPLWLVGASVILVVLGVVMALLSARQPETTYPPDSPEGTVASFLRLLQDGQVDQAYTLVAMNLDRQEFQQRYADWSQQSHRVTLVRSSMRGDTATVTVDLATFSAGPFGAEDQTSRETFTLERKAGMWRITGPLYFP